MARSSAWQRGARGLAFGLAVSMWGASGAASVQPNPPATATAAANVTVTYADPAKFSEARMFGMQDRFTRSDYLPKLKAYLIAEAGRVLGAGERLDVTITDIKLAGAYEPWHGPQWDDVRFMRDIYPPRIDLHFRLTDAQGQVLREGSRVLRGLDYLHRDPILSNQTDPLRYDKALLKRWLRKGPAAL